MTALAYIGVVRNFSARDSAHSNYDTYQRNQKENVNVIENEAFELVPR